MAEPTVRVSARELPVDSNAVTRTRCYFFMAQVQDRFTHPQSAFKDTSSEGLSARDEALCSLKVEIDKMLYYSGILEHPPVCAAHE